MQILKSDIINDAYSALRISGLTVIPGAEDLKLALWRLEAMAAEWDDKGYHAGYKFEELPDTGDPSGVELKYSDAFSTGLAMRLAHHFGKEIPISISLMFNAAFSALVSGTARTEQTQYPHRMPRGSGSNRTNRWRRYYTPEQTAPIESDTNHMAVSEINSDFEDYTSYLDDGEYVATISTEITDGIELVSGALNTDGYRYSYTIKALGYGFNQLKITATTDAGRVDVRRINFQVSI